MVTIPSTQVIEAGRTSMDLSCVNVDLLGKLWPKQFRLRFDRCVDVVVELLFWIDQKTGGYRGLESAWYTSRNFQSTGTLPLDHIREKANIPIKAAAAKAAAATQTYRKLTI